MSRDALTPARQWFRQKGWKPFPFQLEAWRHAVAGESGLIHAATGTGKTLAAWLGSLLHWRVRHPDAASPPPLTALWITPLRALSADTEKALRHGIDGLGLPWTLESRTGDSSASLKARQRRRLPSALITTPESLMLLLARAEAREHFATLETVVVDEWHELLGSKRGVQTELGLARLRSWCPELRTWGLSATLGNLEAARDVLLGVDDDGNPNPGVLIRGSVPKPLAVDALLPMSVDRFPWSGHIGLTLLPQVLDAIEEGQTALVFTNTRSNCELWYQAIVTSGVSWADRVGIHHGSLDRRQRDAVEDGLRNGSLRCVVCTSSLDLGVDFSPVDRVIQVGSPKGAARLVQRAGRSGHQPGATSRLTVAPTHAFELVDVAAARDVVASGNIESRPPLERPLDVLVQHVVTCALGGGFTRDRLLAEVRRSHAYRLLSDEEWDWVLDFATFGGSTLHAYPEYARIREDEDGRYQIASKVAALRHRMSIGTIVSDASIAVRYLSGRRLGTVEESFAARLRKGDAFIFAGVLLEFVRIREMTAWVRKATSPSRVVPRWAGARMPLSTELAAAVRARLDAARRGEFTGAEMDAVRPILELQAEWSAVPAQHEFLVERVRSREGHHLFFFPVDGRLVHEGLAALFAYRLAQLAPLTFTLAANDYGFELLSPEAAPLEEALDAGLLQLDHLAHDILASLNATELARRRFREIARVAGLVFPGYPGRAKSVRQLQASSELLYDVFVRYDPGNLLVRQAFREVLERQLEESRLSATLRRLGDSTVVLRDVEHPTPMAFSLIVDRTREKLSSEKLADRVRRMIAPLERAAGPAPRWATLRGVRNRTR